MHTYRKLANNSCEIVLIIKQFYIREILWKGLTLIAVFIKAKIVQNMCFSSSEKDEKAIQWLSWYFKKLNPLGEKISL